MVVETCLNLAKKLIRLEKSMEQLSTSLTKYSGDFSQHEINLPYDYGADKSSATSSVEDDGTRDEAWHLLCRKFEEASKRLVIFRTQNRAMRPLKPTKLALLALAQTKEEGGHMTFSAFPANNNRSSSQSLNDHLDPDARMATLAESRSRSLSDLLATRSDGEEAVAMQDTTQSGALLGRLDYDEAADTRPKHYHSNPDLTTSDDSSHPMRRVQQVRSESLGISKTPPLPPKRGTTLPKESQEQNGVFNERTASNSWSPRQYNKKHSNNEFENDFEYHLETRVLPTAKYTFKPDKYLIQNNRQQKNHTSASNSVRVRNESTQQQQTVSSRGFPPPPVDNETSDYFEDDPSRRESDDGSELDEDTLRKILDMQEEIQRCHPTQDTEVRVQTPVKLKLTDQDFNESYARMREDQPEEVEEGGTRGGAAVLQRYRGIQRPQQPPPDTPTTPTTSTSTATATAYDTMNKSGNNSHTDSQNDSMQSAAMLEATLRHDMLNEEELLLLSAQDEAPLLRPPRHWYDDVTDSEETRLSPHDEEYFTLL